MIISDNKYSPAAQMPVDHNSKSEVMQKKVIDCPISSQEPERSMMNIMLKGSLLSNLPVSRTVKKNDIVIPTALG